jgi:quinol monooxygenase YgiN
MAVEIEAGTSLATLINVFETTPETQQRLLTLLHEATEDSASKHRGFVSASFHVSRDGLRIVNYAQWESPEALQAYLADPARKPMVEKILEVAVSADPHVYDVASSYTR